MGPRKLIASILVALAFGLTNAQLVPFTEGTEGIEPFTTPSTVCLENCRQGHETPEFCNKVCSVNNNNEDVAPRPVPVLPLPPIAPITPLAASQDCLENCRAGHETPDFCNKVCSVNTNDVDSDPRPVPILPEPPIAPFNTPSQDCLATCSSARETPAFCNAVCSSPRVVESEKNGCTGNECLLEVIISEGSTMGLESAERRQMHERRSSAFEPFWWLCNKHCIQKCLDDKWNKSEEECRRDTCKNLKNPDPALYPPPPA